MSHRSPFRKTVGVYEVGMATPYTSSSRDPSYKPSKPMEKFPSKSTDRTDQSRQKTTSGKSSPKGENHVNFESKEKQVEKREKYLTAKYGAHQMLLIKKRLAVEMWIFDELGRLYCTEDDDHDCNLELEEILNMDTDNERRAYAMEQLTNTKVPADEVNKFVEELLKRAKTL